MTKLNRIARSALALLGIAFAGNTADAAVSAKGERPAIERLDQIRGDLLKQFPVAEGQEIAWNNWDDWSNWDDWPNQWTNY